MDYRKTAEEIYEKVGRRENLVSAAHCATRLRLVLADDAKCDVKAVEEIDGVKGVFSASGQLQIILGTGTVNKVYDEFLAVSGMSGMSKEEAAQAAVDAVKSLAVRVGIPQHLSELGIKESDLPKLADSAIADGCTPGNPREVTRDIILDLYRKVL